MQYNTVRTDLALEAKEAAGEIPGVEMEQEKIGETTVTRVRVINDLGQRVMGKPIGNYITIENRDLSNPEGLKDKELSQTIAREIRALMADDEDKNAMVAGLGNRHLTPDSLGPRVTNKILVSRHIKAMLPDMLDERVHCVSAISPGVMGETGIETGELVRSAVQTVKPSCLIVVDSLAARSAARILGTVQISDVGVVPGSGVGNHRTALTKETLGLPVIAIGVPMVVHAAVIGRDILENAVELIIEDAGDNERLKEDMQQYLHDENMNRLMETALDKAMQGFVVTPVSIDDAVRNVASLVAEGINIALQPELSLDEISAMM